MNKTYNIVFILAFLVAIVVAEKKQGVKYNGIQKMETSREQRIQDLKTNDPFYMKGNSLNSPLIHD